MGKFIREWDKAGFIAEISGKLADRMEMVGQLVEERAKANAPLRTGLMKQEIAHQTTVWGPEITAWLGMKRHGGKSAFYWRFVEFGTKGAKAKWRRVRGTDMERKTGAHHATSAKPFLRRAIFENAAEIMRIVKGR